MAPCDLAHAVEWACRWWVAVMTEERDSRRWHRAMHKHDLAMRRLNILWTSSGHFWLP